MSALSRWLFFSGIQLALTALSSPRVQLGGTVGDIESMPFVEAMRQFQFKVKPENFCLVIHLFDFSFSYVLFSKGTRLPHPRRQRR